MAKIEKLQDDDLDLVSGGQITYTWDGSSGTIGMDGFNPFALLDMDGFVAYYNSVHGTMSDAEILTNLMAQGIIAKR